MDECTLGLGLSVMQKIDAFLEMIIGPADSFTQVGKCMCALHSNALKAPSTNLRPEVTLSMYIIHVISTCIK